MKHFETIQTLPRSMREATTHESCSTHMLLWHNTTFIVRRPSVKKTELVWSLREGK